MSFLDKLYDSNYFGIGLFAVISFLVVSFLVVLFFGKKDEKKRKLEELVKINNSESNTFADTSNVTSLEVPVEKTMEPVLNNVTPEIEPINNTNIESLKPVAPIQYEDAPVENLIEEPQVNVSIEPAQTIEPIVEPIAPVEPVKIETINFDLPKEPITNNSIEEMPNIEPVIVEEPEVMNTYYNPEIENTIDNNEIEEPKLNYDELANSISKELDELENKNESVNQVPKFNSQFSSVYVSDPVTPVTPASIGIDLPKKLDLPTMKNDNENNENYNL